MNGVATFRLCELSNDELIKKVDSGTDEMFKTGNIPTRNIPARPEQDYDLLVGEMIYRFDEQSRRIRELEGALESVDKDLGRYGVAVTSRSWKKVKQALNKTETKKETE